MTKLTLGNVANLQNESSVVTTLALNNAATVAALENTISRDGTTPNQMNADYDMNSNRILNLPDATDAHEPATFGQLEDRIEAVGNGAVLSADYITVNPNILLPSARTIASGINTSLTDTGAGGQMQVNVANTTLNALATVPTNTDTMAYFTAIGSAASTPITSFARTVVDDVDAPTLRTTIGLGNVDNTSDVTKNAAAVTLTNKTIDTAGPNTIKVNGNTLAATAGTATVTVPNSTDTLVGRATTDTLTNKSISGSGNTLTNVPISTAISGLATGVATFLGTPSSANLKAAVTDETGSGALVFGTSPAITTPTGIVKGDVGLGSVDNTSDATKNSASVTLTNKTIDTAGPNILKVNGNTLSATAGTATVTVPNSTDTLVGKATTDTLTNKTIDTAGPNTLKVNGNTFAATAGTATITVPNSTDTLVGRATTDTLTGKTINGASNTLTVLGGTQVSGQVPVANGGTGATSISSALDTAFSSTQGSILYRNATNWVALAPGTSGNFLKSLGAAANPAWSAVPGGGDLLSTNNLSDLTNAVTARQNLAIGKHGADIVAAATINLQTATGDVVDVTGNTTITAVTLNDGEERTVRFTGTPILTHGASLVIPGAVSMFMAAGDYVVFRGYASSVVRVTNFQRASLTPIDGTAWTATTPTATFSSGSGTCAMRTKQIGKTVFLSLRITCTATGTLASVPPPTTVNASVDYIMVGREINRTGLMWFAMINSTAISFGTQTNGVSAMNTGDVVELSGIYEAA